MPELDWVVCRVKSKGVQYGTLIISISIKSHLIIHFITGKNMSTVIDGKAFAAGLRERVAQAVKIIGSQNGIKPGLRGCFGRRGSGQPGLCQKQGQANRGSRHELV